MRLLLAQCVHIIHLICVLFFTFAWLIPSPSAWKLHLFATPLMVLQWRLNRDMCLLTNLELWLRENKWYPAIKNRGQFLQTIFVKIFRKEAGQRTLLFVTYGVLLGSATLSALRLELFE